VSPRRAPGPSAWEQPRAGKEQRRARRGGVLRRLAWAAGLVAVFAFVVWRQTVGTDRLRELERLREEVAVAEAEKGELVTRILELERRERIVRYARDRLGMHVARDDEVIMLPLPASAVATDSGEDG